MLNNVNQFLKNRNQIFLWSLVLILISILGIVDHITGYEVGFSLFYTIPVSISALYLNRPSSRLVSFLSAATWTLVDATSGQVYSQQWIQFWNGSIRLSFFLIISELIYQNQIKIILLQNFSEKDPLTGIFNARGIYARIERDLNSLTKSNQSFSIAYIDLDNFKKVNDTFGHSIGDKLLVEFSSLIQTLCEPNYTFGRIGGDEFIIFMPMTDEKKAINRATLFKDKTIERMQANHWPVTCSIGLITSYSKIEKIDTLISTVDNLMYNVKNNGKNAITHKVI